MHTGWLAPLSTPESRENPPGVVRLLSLFLFLTLCVQAGCAHSIASTDSGEVPRRSDVITRGDIDRTDAATAFDVVHLIRAHWISPSRARGQSPIRVYVDNVLRGGLEELRLIQSNQVKVIQYFNARDATTRWGTDHSGGVIHVELQYPSL